VYTVEHVAWAWLDAHSDVFIGCLWMCFMWPRQCGALCATISDIQNLHQLCMYPYRCLILTCSCFLPFHVLATQKLEGVDGSSTARGVEAQVWCCFSAVSS
jgi:hypothetical protein